MEYIPMLVFSNEDVQVGRQTILLLYHAEMQTNMDVGLLCILVILLLMALLVFNLLLGL